MNNEELTMSRPGQALPSASFRDAQAAKSMSRLAQGVKLFCLLGALVILLGPIAFWTNPEWVESSARQQLHQADTLLQLDTGARFLGWLSSWLLGGVRLFALWQVWVLFSCFQRGEVFATEPALRLRRFAFALVAHTLASPLGDTLSVLALTISNPPGQRLLNLGLGFEHGFSLFFGLIFWAIARVMFEATRVAQENAEFV